MSLQLSHLNADGSDSNSDEEKHHLYTSDNSSIKKLTVFVCLVSLLEHWFVILLFKFQGLASRLGNYCKIPFFVE